MYAHSRTCVHVSENSLCRSVHQSDLRREHQVLRYRVPMRHLQNFRGCEFSSRHLVTRLISAGNLLNRPSPHRSPVKLITFTSVLYFLKARRNSASRGKEHRFLSLSLFFSPFFFRFSLLGSMIFHIVRNLMR